MIVGLGKKVVQEDTIEIVTVHIKYDYHDWALNCYYFEN